MEKALPPLDPTLRKTLEKKIVEARDASEDAAGAAIRALAVHKKEAHASLTQDERHLRRALRAKARQLGTNPERDLGPLVEECAYEQWHRMLFARFLAENGLLMHPDYEGVSVTLEECAELARDEGDPDAWATASRYASAMLPGIFRTGDPLLEVRLFPEGRRSLERVISEIPPSPPTTVSAGSTSSGRPRPKRRSTPRGARSGATTSPPSPSYSPRTTW
jgi:hypothetical protein